MPHGSVMTATSRRGALRWLGAGALAGSSMLWGCSKTSSAGQAGGLDLLNVSYDPTNELYQAINSAFIATPQGASLKAAGIKQSHGGSGKQALAVLQGLKADVVTLALAPDIDMLANKGQLLPTDWQQRLPHNSTPFTSTIVFLVRKGNPKNIKDWSDLVRDGVQVITPNPKTSGGARWNYLAAWGAVQKQTGSAAQAQQLVAALFKNVSVLDAGARGALLTFTQRKMGDVLLSWENEAYLAVHSEGGSEYEIVVPSHSILAEPPVAWIDKNVDHRGTRDVATAYLQFLFTPEAQQIGAKHFYRPVDPTVQKNVASNFAPVELFTVDQLFGGWDQVKQQHFSDGGIYDRMVAARA